MTTLLHQQSSDIFVKDRPIGLSIHAPEIFQDYAISRDTAISIMPSMERLLTDPTFRQIVKETLGRMTLVDIKVRGEDNAVFVRDPHTPNSEYEEVDFHEIAAVREVSDKTQIAYRRFKDSQPSSHKSSSKRVSSPSPQLAYSHSFQHKPSPLVDPSFYSSCIQNLEAELLQTGKRNAELERQLEELQSQNHELRMHSSSQGSLLAREQEKSRNLEQSLLDSEERCRALQKQLKLAGAELDQLKPENMELRKELDNARRELEEMAHVVSEGRQREEDLSQLAKSYHETIARLEKLLETELQANQGLQTIIQGVRTELPNPPLHNRDLPNAVRALRMSQEKTERARIDLQQQLELAGAELNQLKPENAHLRRELDTARRELEEIAQAVSDGRQREETLPQLVKRYHETIARLEKLLETELQANRGLQTIIQGVRTELPNALSYNEDLPGAVRTLRISQENAERAQQTLHQELQVLKEQHTDKVAILDRISVVLDKQGEPHESLPELVGALGEENRELKQRIAEHVAAQERLNEVLQIVSELTGERIESIEDLPGVVEWALGEVQKRAELSDRHADSLQERVIALTNKMEHVQRAHAKELDSREEAIQKLQLRAVQAEAELMGEQGYVLELQSQAETLRQECRKIKRDLREAQKQHAENLSALRRELQLAQKELVQEKNLTAALQKDVKILRQAARNTDLRHQEELHKQEAAHQRTLKPLYAKLQKVTHLNGVQEKTIASLRDQFQEQTAALSEALRIGDKHQESISLLTARVEELELALTNAEEVTKASEKQRAEEREHHQKLQSQLQRDLLNTGTENQTLRKTIADLKKDLKSTQEALDAAESLGKSQESEIIRQTKRIKTLQTQLEERAAISQQELDALREETRRLRDLLETIDSFARQVPVKRKSCSLGEELSKFERLEKTPQRSDYTYLPQQIQEIIEALIKEVQELKRKDHAVKELEIEIAELKLQLEKQHQRSSETQYTLQQRIEELEHQNRLDLEEASAQVDTKNALVEQLRQTLASERSERDKALQERRERIQELEEALQESEHARKELAHDFRQQGIELQEKREYIEDLEHQVEELEEKKKELGEILVALRKSLQVMEEDRDWWHEEANGYSSDCSKIRQQYSDLQIRCRQLESEISQLREILAVTLSVQKDVDLDQLHKARVELYGRVEDMNSEIDVLTQKVARIEDLRATLEEERDIALRKAKDFQEKLMLSQDEVAKQKFTILDMQQRSGLLQRRLNGAERVITDQAIEASERNSKFSFSFF